MKNVLVTSAGTRVAYTICKALAKRGCRVFAGDSSGLPMTAVSRHCAGSFRYASPFLEEERFLADIADRCRRHDIEVIIPALEETYCLARHKDHLPARVRSLLPDYAGVTAVHDKGNLARLAASLGIPMPRSHEASAVLQQPELLRDFHFPALLKPKQGGGGWAMCRLPNPEALPEVLRREGLSPERFIVQEEIAGETVCACAIYHNGRYLAGDAYRTLRTHPQPYGQATVRESVRGGQALELLRALLDHLAWNGVCEADFLVERASGRAHLLDVNPRFWGSLAQNIAAGLDYPYYYYLLALGGELPAVRESTPGVRTVWLGGNLLRAFLGWWESDKKLRFPAGTLQANGKVAAYDDWDPRDPLPFLAWGLGQCKKKLCGERGDALPGVWG